MSSFTAIDLSELPPPECVETYDFETIYTTMKETLNGLVPMFFDGSSRDPVVLEAEQHTDNQGTAWFKVPRVVEHLLYVDLESDPTAKILAVCAYRECLLRQKINESLKAVMLAYAQGADLDQHGANYRMTRLLIDPGDPDAIPPVPPVYESDTEFRRRILLVFESLSVAGSEGAYIYHTLNAHPNVLDAAVKSPTPGTVLVTVMAREGDGTAASALLQAVDNHLQAADIRPLTDKVTVQSAKVISYQVNARLVLYGEPDSNLVLVDALARVRGYIAHQHRIGLDVTLSGLYSSLHTNGVANVILVIPTADVVTTDEQTAYCTSVNVTLDDR